MRHGCLILGLVFLFGITGCSDDNTTDAGDTTPPSQVTDLVTIAVTDTSITLAWTAPGDDGDQGTASEYDLRYSTEPDSSAYWWDSLAVSVAGLPAPKSTGQRESLGVHPLDAETEYFFALTAADEVPNWSDVSNVANRSTVEPPDQAAPANIGDLSVESVSDTSVTLTWTAPGDDGQIGTALAYDVRFATDPVTIGNWELVSQAAGEPVPMPAGSKELFEVTRLVAGRTYWFAVKACDDADNCSDPSNTISAEPDATPPGKIVDLRVTGVSDSSVTLTWTAPDDDGSKRAASRYDLRYSTAPITNETWDSDAVMDGLPRPGAAGSEETFEAQGLESQTTYYMAIKTGDEVPNWSGISNNALATTTPPGAVPLVVYPDGTGQYPTIQAAIDAAVDGDVVELVDGTYLGIGNRAIRFHGKAITLKSQSGDPAACIIDAEGVSRCILFIDGEGPGTLLEDVTIQHGLAAGGGQDNGQGGGILCGGSSPRIHRCTFRENSAADSGGGFHCYGDASPTITECSFSLNNCDTWGGGASVVGEAANALFLDCSFVDNWSDWGAGAFIWDSPCLLERCTFSGNIAPEVGGGVLSISDYVTFRHCLFTGNFSERFGGGAAFAGEHTATIENCTFVFNGAPEGGGLDCEWGTLPRIENSIIAFNDGEGLLGGEGEWAISCTNIYGNTKGDWIGDIAELENLNNNNSVDPLFCDPETAPLYLRADSPCAPENNSACGLIGALPVGCSKR